MAKVKTTEIDDQLSVILNQTKESGEFVKEANRTIELFKRQIAHFSAETVNMHESKAKELNGLIEANLRLFGGEIKRTAETLKEATATIVQTKNQAIEEIKKVAENKMTYSKFTVWIASIAAIVMVGFVRWIEVQRRIDVGTINDAVNRANQEVETNQQFYQWLKLNPKTREKFVEWKKEQDKKKDEK